MNQIQLEIDDNAVVRKICGFQDRNLRTMEEILGLEIIPRGNTFILKGKEHQLETAEKLLHSLSDHLHGKEESFELDDMDLRYIAQIARDEDIRADEIAKLKIVLPESRKTITPKSLNQARYISAIGSVPIVFGAGPAGTGKTYLAVAAALRQFYEGKATRIVLTRPAVEAGESLGYLPGDLIEKINPYLRPLYDALFEFVPVEKVSKMIENGTIEIAPLAYMRGRTLNNAVVILDEAQNTTISQMKMFLTRLGVNSTIVVSGDPTQVDLGRRDDSGLIHAMKILTGIGEIEFVHFMKDDICRHPVVQKIVDAYEKGAH
jgi:phosphate starvation-inducible PhoH-like protein